VAGLGWEEVDDQIDFGRAQALAGRLNRARSSGASGIGRAVDADRASPLDRALSVAYPGANP